MFTVDSISIRYEKKCVINNFSFSVKKGEIVSIIGPNGSGKSTLLKAMNRMLPCDAGRVVLEGKNMKEMNAKEVARVMCMLSQKNQAPGDMSVADLVSYGRFPHKKWYEKLNKEDMDIVDWALEKTSLTEYRDRPVGALSGGESQRAWIAMALAQRPKILLLDEPTTYLDISHQHEVLELVRELNRDMGMTVVMVLHDLNQASYYSDRIIVVQGGRNCMCGTPKQVMTSAMIRDVYRMDADIQYLGKEASPRIHLLSTAK
ncbi:MULTISPECIES: ABC transporter ATP-binding protein [unclassified Paenibacillus]|uniref:ABC transporter ATP-binding protein n=1 Tax=unclassified Paenibacillus TaxID=185978 RepID=UPI002F3FF2E4